jgi:PAS domain S-box-containing protein
MDGPERVDIEVESRPAGTRGLGVFASPGLWKGYGIAIAGVAVATVIRAIDYGPLNGGLPFLTFFPVVILAALVGGRGPGVLAGVLSVVASALWLKPHGTPISWNINGASGEFMFAGVCVLAIWLCDRATWARRRAGEAVAERTRLAAIVAYSDDAIISKSLDGVVLSWNSGAERLFGYSAQEMIGSSIERIIPEDRAGEEQEMVARLRVGEQVDHFETVRKRKDGSVVEISVSLSPLVDASGRMIGASKIARDIGERRHIEAERREEKREAEANLAQLQAVIGSMAEGLVVTDAHGNVLRWNRAALAMHGFASMEEVPASKDAFSELFELRRAGGEIIPVREWPLSRMLRGETVENDDVQVVRKDGTLERTIRCSGTALRDVEGQITLAVLTLHDRSEERRTQESLRKSAQHLSLAMEAAELGDWVWDAASDVMALSARAAEIFGVAREPAKTRTEMRDLIHQEDREAARLAAERSSALREDYDMQYRVNRPDGVQVWVAAKGRGQYGPDGKITGMLGIVQDVTQRKAAEEALRESEERLRLGMDAGNTGTWDWDIAGDRVTWSDRVYEFHGLKPGEFSGRVEDFTRLVHPDDVANVRAAIERSLQEGAPYHVEFRVVHREGEVRWISTNGKVYYDAEGRALRMLGATTDVTVRKLAELERDRLLEGERQARSEAEHSSRMKDEFLATLSHELRTPLNAILGWSQLLGRGGDDPGMLEEGLAVIERNTRAQAQLIDDLLDMSRIISGKIRLDVRLVDPVSVIEAAIETVTPAAVAKGIKIETAMDHRAGPISGDPNRLQQVVWNVLSNAIKFTSRGGRVSITLERVESVVEVSVTDTGQGITPEFLPHVFERFRQADASSTRRHGGLGLGLAIVKQIVELHGGTIQAMSEGEGMGSVFRISLPLSSGAGEETALPGEVEKTSAALQCRSTELAGLKILVVDDEPDARRLVRRLLEECAARVITAGSAREAMPLVEAERPDVLICDIGMADVDGYEFLRQVRVLGEARGGRVPAVALTAFARSEDRTRALLSGFLVHVSKPVEPEELVATIASVAGRTGVGDGK